MKKNPKKAKEKRNPYEYLLQVQIKYMKYNNTKNMNENDEKRLNH